MARDNDTIRATPRYRPCKTIPLLDSTGKTSAWWDNFVNEVVGPEEWRENFRMARKNFLKLKLPNFVSVDAEHLFRFHVWTQNICSVFALKVAFSNLSGRLWTRPQSVSQSVAAVSHLGPVHTNADSFESVYFLTRLGLPSTLTRSTLSLETLSKVGKNESVYLSC